jgi:NitT/TauT family transport system ATP-binding protein
VVNFADAPVRDATPEGVAIVFQDYSRSLLPWKTNLGNVLFGMRRIGGLTTAEKVERAIGLLDTVGLAGFKDRYPWQLSGGMQQRVAIARGLASQSRLLLLDEPLASVDAQTRADLQDLLLSIAGRYRQTCLLVTHDVEEAIYMGDRIVVLSGRPTRVVREIAVPLPRPRDQIETRETPTFLEIRHDVLSLIRSVRRAGAKGAAP